jgi:two-component system, NtrC family, sensor histidine kinase HydH
MVDEAGGGTRLPAPRLRAAILLAGIGVVSLLHYVTAPSQSVWHAIYQHLYHVPVIFGAYWFGVKGGLLLATMAAVTYVPHIGGFHDQDPRFAVSQYIEILLLYIIGAIVGLLASNQRRLTDRYRATAESLREANLQLTRSHAEVRRADRLSGLGQIAAGLAHELRNPLASIKGALEIVGGRAAPGTPEAEFSGLADAELGRLDSLLTDFLAYARPREPQFVTTPLSDIIQHVLALLRPIGECSAVTLAASREPGDRLVRADREQIEQVLFNVIVNAVQASPHGGTVTVHEAGEAGACVIAVTDQGAGIDPTLLDQVFEPFFTTKKRGTGLGLAIGQRIVMAHGGRIQIVAGEGGGTVCRIVLPQVPAGSPAGGRAEVA